MGDKAAEAWWMSLAHHAPATKRIYRSRVSQFCDWLVAQGHLKRNPIADLPKVKVPRQVHCTLDLDQTMLLLAACNDQRERVIVTLGLQQGMRRCSIAWCEVGDFAWSTGTMLVRNKGGGKAWRPITAETRREVRAYLSQEPANAGPLVRRKDGLGGGITPQMVGLLFRRVAERAGVKVAPGDGVATHIMRHTAATDVEQRSKDPRAVQEFLCHEELSSTQVYLGQLPNDRLRAAVEGRCYCGSPSCAGRHDDGDESPLNIVGRLLAGDANLLAAVQHLIAAGLIDPGVGTQGGTHVKAELPTQERDGENEVVDQAQDPGANAAPGLRL